MPAQSGVAMIFKSWVDIARRGATLVACMALTSASHAQSPGQAVVPIYRAGYSNVAYGVAPVASYNPVGFGFGGYSYGGYPAYGYNGNLPAAYEGFTGYGSYGATTAGYPAVTVVGYRGMTTIGVPGGYSYYNMSDTWAAVCGPSGCRVVYRAW